MDQLKEHPQIVELLDTLDKNGLMKEKNEVQSLVSYIGGMEETLTGMLGELQDMRLYHSWNVPLPLRLFP